MRNRIVFDGSFMVWSRAHGTPLGARWWSQHAVPSSSSVLGGLPPLLHTSAPRHVTVPGQFALM